MNIEKLAELSIGLAAAIGVLWIFLQMMKEWRKGKPEASTGENGHSGSKPISFWQMEFRKAIKEVVEAEFKAAWKNADFALLVEDL